MQKETKISLVGLNVMFLVIGAYILASVTSGLPWTLGVVFGLILCGAVVLYDRRPFKRFDRIAKWTVLVVGLLSLTPALTAMAPNGIMQGVPYPLVVVVSALASAGFIGLGKLSLHLERWGETRKSQRRQGQD